MRTKMRPSQNGEPTDRQTLAKQYQVLFDQTEEKTAEWYASGTIAAAFAGTGPIAQVRERLEQERDQCYEHAEAHGHYPDSQYGTYRVYMETKAAFYERALQELDQIDVSSPVHCARRNDWLV
jgi:hypothetical protein